MSRLAAIWVTLSFILAVPGPAQESTVVVGVLEWSRCPPDSPVTVSARALFRLRGAEWIALTHPEASDATLNILGS